MESIVFFVFCSILIFITAIEISKVKNLSKEKETLKKELHSINADMKVSTKFYSKYIKELQNEICTIQMEKTGDELYEFLQGKKAIIGTQHEQCGIDLKKILNQFGLYVDIVKTGDDILDQFKYGINYDIVFTSSMYRTGQIHDGTTLLTTLNKNYKLSIPIVVYTIYGNERKSFIADGFDEVLSKPVNYESTKKILEKFLKDRVKKKNE